MIKHYLKLALRDLRRSMVYGTLNIMGLATGMAVALLIFLFVRYELSYDEFHRSAPSTYRVLLEKAEGNGVELLTLIPEMIASELRKTFPEITYAVRLTGPFDDMLMSIGEKSFFESNFLYAGPAFFEIFSFKAISGHLETALSEPNSIVLTASTAKKFFGTSSVVGRVILVGGRQGNPYTVTAVIEDVPGNTHLDFNLVAFRESTENSQWNLRTADTYIVLRSEDNRALFEGKLPDFVARNATHTGEPGEDDVS